jgi:hypothetical protein
LIALRRVVGTEFEKGHKSELACVGRVANDRGQYRVSKEP